jgi:hypothetical protein
MANNIYRIMHIMHAADALAADDVVNTYHVVAPDTYDISTGWTAVDTAIKTFYNFMLAYTSVDYNAHRGIKWYNLADPQPRVPIHVIDYTYTGTIGTTSAPHEVSLAVSFHAQIFSGDVGRRHRGRVYLGPFTALTASVARPGSSSVTAIAGAFDTMRLAIPSGTSSNVHLAVYSRKDNVAREVIGGYIDDEWDTQRRRGMRASSRTTFGS